MLKFFIDKLGLLKVLVSLSFFFKVVEVKKERDKQLFTGLWYKIWLEQGYANKDDHIRDKYAKYDQYSADFLIKLFGLLPVGTFRIIRYSEDLGLPALNDFDLEIKIEESTVIEATLFTVKRSFRGIINFPKLLAIRTIYRYAKKAKLLALVVAIDRRFFIQLKRMGFPFQQIGKEKMYEGSMTYPAFLNFSTCENELKKKNGVLFKFLADK